jgi:hypothetical protein
VINNTNYVIILGKKGGGANAPCAPLATPLLYLYVFLPDVGVVYVCFCIYVFLQGAYLWTPVLLASDDNHIDVLELLIQHGAQLDVRNEVSISIVQREIFVGANFHMISHSALFVFFNFVWLQ